MSIHVITHIPYSLLSSSITIAQDDCWSATTRDASGQLMADPKKFPNGLKPVADYVHSKGLKFGV